MESVVLGSLPGMKYMTIITTNKRALYDYIILETYEAGIELSGQEVKSIKNGRINLSGSHVIIKNNEALLFNADIPPYQPKNAPEDYGSKRSRRLLLHKSEIKSLIGKTREKSLTLVPLKVYTKHHKIKLEIGLVKSRKKADKRDLIKKRETRREIKKVIG